MSEKIAIVGSGLIGWGWAIVFARARCEVALYDSAADAVVRALEVIEVNLADLEAVGLIDSAAQVRARMRPVASLAEALDGAVYAQESVPEDAAIKHAVFRDMDAAAAPEAVLASSCSSIPGSRFLDVVGRSRCLVNHPVSPPYLVPLVELVPTPWTMEDAVTRCHELMTAVGQVPIRLSREIEGFVLNRLQAALVNEAVHLVALGIASPEDVDRTVSHGLGLRCSFMGPFETMDMNAPSGFLDYATRYGHVYETLGRDSGVAEPWATATLEAIERTRRARVPAGTVGERQIWRDRRLMALRRHKSLIDEELGT